MNISKHTKNRYVERYVSLAENETPSSYLAKNEERVAEWITKEMEHATLFFTGQIKSKHTVNYYITNNNHIYITDTRSNNVITTYPVQYGFSEDIDKSITDMVLKELKEHQDSTKDKQADNRKSLDELYKSQAEAEDEVKLLENKLKQAKDNKRLVDDIIDLTISDNTALVAKEKDLAYKLINSKYYLQEIQEKVL